MYVYITSEPGLRTVGFYDPSGKWHPEKDVNTDEQAAERVHWLNGGNKTVQRTPAELLKLGADISMLFYDWTRQDDELATALSGLQPEDRRPGDEERDNERIRLRRADQIRKVIYGE